MAIPNMNNRNRNNYINNRNIRQHNVNNKFEITPQMPIVNEDIPNNDFNDSVPPLKSNTSQNNFNTNSRILGGSIGGILDILNSKNISLDRDRIVILILMFLLYKENKESVNLKLLLALGYILL